MTNAPDRLRAIKTFESLIRYLEEELDWPLAEYDFDELTFEYSPAELGLKEQDAAKVRAIHQLRPLQYNQPWGIFFVEFENKRMPVVVLRRILSHLVLKKRASANRAQAAAWHLHDLLFISAFGVEDSDQREIAFAHFHQETGDLPTLRVLGWDGADTPLKLDHVAATLQARLCWPADPGDADAWRRQWSPAFRHRLGHVIRTADALAERLALLARGIRDAASTLMAHESERGPLRRLHKAFQTALIHDLSEADFADTYAQTITYGLLTAAISRTDMEEGRYGTALVAGNVTDMVPLTNPFLRDMLQTFIKAGGRQGGIDFDELGIQDVVDLLRGDETDLPAILRDFGNRTLHEDPVIYFYEYFAKRYDPKEKVRRGEFYTPQPVVSYIVRSVHELLQIEFGIKDGLASTITWGEMAAGHPDLEIPDGTDPQSPFVVILDPATGTATFLVEVIDVIHRTLTTKWQQEGFSKAHQIAAWNEYVPRHLLPRLYGFELKMAPYSIAHMKIGLKLKETGFTAWASLGDEDRVRVYLTNTLEPATDEDAQLAFAEWAPALAHEAQAVNTVKRRQCFTVVIGNPPYSGHSANESEWIAGLLRGVDGQGRRVESYFEVDRHDLGERNPKWLNDDYVKFVRFGQWRINQTGTGILAFITNHGYLENPTFRGMRQSLMTDFDLTYVLDLHGSLIRKQVPPEESVDENVFDIQPGVAIILVVKHPTEATEVSKANHCDLWGLRQRKYEWLLSEDVRSTNWMLLTPQSPLHLYVPRDANLMAQYHTGRRLTKVWPVNSVGIVTARDHLTIQWSPDEVWRIVNDFVELPVEEARRKYALRRDVQDWKVHTAQTDVRASGPVRSRIIPVLYRPFDIRFTYYTGRSRGFICRPRSEVMRHMLAGANLGLVSARSNKSTHMNHFFVSRSIMEAKCGESTTQSCIFPLYLYPSADGMDASRLQLLQVPPWSMGENGRAPNLSVAFVKELEKRQMLEFVAQRTGDLHVTFGPEDIAHFIYAVVHSPVYRDLYADFLKLDYPHIPFPSDRELFVRLVGLGADLVALHLLEDDYSAASWNQGRRPQGVALQNPITAFVRRATGTTLGVFSKSTCYQDGRVYLDTSQRSRSSYFEGVPEEVWNFHIGGYQVLYKWLYDRRGTKGQPGRTLTEQDIAHYQRIVVALKETMRLMQEIDEVIEAHGGWPIE